MRKSFAVAFLGVLMATGAGPLGAQNTWSHEVTPMMWVSGADGTVDFLSEDGPISLDFDVLWRMGVGAAFTAQGTDGKWGYLVDGAYGHAPVDKYRASLTFVTAGATYQASDRVNLVFGFRYALSRADIKVPNVDGLPDDDGEVEDFKNLTAGDGWVDPFVGVQLRLPLTPRMTFDGYFDAGALKSNLTWQAVVGLGYEVRSGVTARAGYRMISADYDDDNSDVDIMFGGVYAGVTFRF